MPLMSRNMTGMANKQVDFFQCECQSKNCSDTLLFLPDKLNQFQLLQVFLKIE